mmetsp:Transcript_12820/g.22944  ORF Transcript_12820/g.22944 Transcript_12820/m.22944 type:complete len:203 (-) Transcript_12820:2229-2837(-)
MMGFCSRKNSTPIAFMYASSGAGLYSGVIGSMLAAAIVNLMGALFCRANSTCRTHSESLPPDTPTRSRSPSLIMPKSPMAFPTSPLRGFGMLGCVERREKRGPVSALTFSCGSSSSTGSSIMNPSSSPPPSTCGSSFTCSTLPASRALAPLATRASITELVGRTDCTSVLKKMPSPGTSCGWSGRSERKECAASAGSANQRR